MPRLVRWTMRDLRSITTPSRYAMQKAKRLSCKLGHTLDLELLGTPSRAIDRYQLPVAGMEWVS
jgi:hypothetical protein